MMNEKTYEVSWAYGETTFINASDEAHARRVAVGMGRALALALTSALGPESAR